MRRGGSALKERIATKWRLLRFNLDYELIRHMLRAISRPRTTPSPRQFVKRSM